MKFDVSNILRKSLSTFTFNRKSTRVRSSESSLVSPNSKQSRRSTSPNSSQRSSLSDISVSTGSHQKPNIRTAKKRDSLNRAGSPSVILTNAATPTKQLDQTVNSKRHADLQNGNVIRNSVSLTSTPAMKTPAIRKTPTLRRHETLPQGVHKPTPLKDSNQNVGLQKTVGTPRLQTNIINNNNYNNKVKTMQIQSRYQNNTSKSETKLQTGLAHQHNRNNSTFLSKESLLSLKRQLEHNSKGFESLAVLLNHCTAELKNEKYKLLQSKLNFEELKASYRRLEDEVHNREDQINLLTDEKSKWAKDSEHLNELIEELQTKECELNCRINIVQSELEDKLKIEKELQDRLVETKGESLTVSEQLNQVEKENSELKNQLTDFKRENEIVKKECCELKEKVSKLKSENQRLQSESVQSESLSVKARDKTPDRSKCSPRREDSSKKIQEGEVCKSSFERKLESDVESFRQALDMKTEELKELRCHMMRLKQDADRLPSLLSSYATLEAKNEVLQSQLSSQTEAARELYKLKEMLQDELNIKNTHVTRLTQRVEELGYKLNQYAEAMEQLVSETNVSTCSPKIYFKYRSVESSPTMENYRRDPDSSIRSHMRGVVEKSDSVSYILEMTEDSSEIVSNIVRRTQSMRSARRSQTLPTKKRNKTVSMSADDTPKHRVRSLSVEEDDPHSSTWSETSETKQLVKLDQSDFATDSIELSTNGDNCEIIEITQNFDAVGCSEKQIDFQQMTSSTSSTSSSSSNYSSYDIESDIYSTIEVDSRDIEKPEVEFKPVLPVYKDIETNEHSILPTIENESSTSDISILKSFVKIPKISGGEAMVSEIEAEAKLSLSN